MVVDCGGGTVDITVHQVVDDGVSLKELYRASGKKQDQHHKSSSHFVTVLFWVLQGVHMGHQKLIRVSKLYYATYLRWISFKNVNRNIRLLLSTYLLHSNLERETLIRTKPVRSMSCCRFHSSNIIKKFAESPWKKPSNVTKVAKSVGVLKVCESF